MSTSSRPLMLSVVLSFSSPALAQDVDASADAAVADAAIEIAPAAPPPTPDESSAELRALLEAMQTAVNARDIDTILTHVDEEAVFTAMNGEVARGPEDVRAYFTRMLEGDAALVAKFEMHLEADEPFLFYGDTAIASGSAHDHYELTDGTIFDLDARWSTTLRREEDGWKLLSFHYSSNVFDNPVLEAQRNVMTYVTIGTGVVSGLAFFLLGRISARAKAQST